MIELKDAIKNGKKFILEVYEIPDEEITDEVVLVSAEEDSGDLSKKLFLVKFRVPLNVKPINSLQNVLGINKRIYYKTVKIDENGKVVGMIDGDSPTNQMPEIQPQTV